MVWAGTKPLHKLLQRFIIGYFFLIVSVPAMGIEVTDSTGALFSLKQPAQRIITLTPHATELMYSAGAGKQMVGAVEYSDYPEAAKQLPQVGGYGGFNIEAIMALQPDLIIYWPEGNSRREIQRLKQLNLPLFGSNPETFEDIARELEKFAILTGHQQQAQPVVTEFRQQFTDLQNRYRHKQRVRVFYQVWNQPLLTQNENSFISRVIELCGGQNIFATLPLVSPQVSVEAVLAANPDVIMASSNDKPPVWLQEWRKYPSLKAVKNNQIVLTHADWLHRPTLRLLDGAKQVCQLLEQAR